MIASHQRVEFVFVLVVATQYTRPCLRTDSLEGKLKEENDYMLSMIISVQIVARGLAGIGDCRERYTHCFSLDPLSFHSQPVFNCPIRLN